MTPFFKTTRHDYCINGVFVRLVNCPIKGDHRQLAPTAEAWKGYAMRRWGKDVVDLTVTWDEHGRVTHNVEFSLGRVADVLRVGVEELRGSRNEGEGK
jgi:hypothetical protein